MGNNVKAALVLPHVLGIIDQMEGHHTCELPSRHRLIQSTQAVCQSQGMDRSLPTITQAVDRHLAQQVFQAPRPVASVVFPVEKEKNLLPKSIKISARIFIGFCVSLGGASAIGYGVLFLVHALANYHFGAVKSLICGASLFIGLLLLLVAVMSLRNHAEDPRGHSLFPAVCQLFVAMILLALPGVL